MEAHGPWFQSPRPTQMRIGVVKKGSESKDLVSRMYPARNEEKNMSQQRSEGCKIA